MERFFAWILALLLMVQPGLAGYAEELPKEFYLQARMSTSDLDEALALVNIDGRAYIAAQDLARAADMELLNPRGSFNGVIHFQNPTLDFVFEVPGAKYVNDKTYLPLKDGTEALGVSYLFDSDTKTLTMIETGRSLGHFVGYCKKIFGNCDLKYSPYFLGYMRDADPYYLSTAYGVLTQYGYLPSDIIAGLASWIFGQYDYKLYNQAFLEILTQRSGQPSDIEASVQELENRLAYASGGMATLLDTEFVNNQSFQQILASVGDGYWMSANLADVRQMMDAIDKYDNSSNIKLSNILATCRNLRLSMDAIDCYVKAFHYGTDAMDSVDLDPDLDRTIKHLRRQLDYNPIDVNLVWSDMVEYIAPKIGDWSFDKWKKLRNTQGTPFTNYGDMILSLFDSITGIGEDVSSVEMGKVLSDIQVLAYESIPTFDVNHSDFDVNALKYCTVLYLRAAQCGYLHFIGEEDVGALAREAVSDLKAMIMEIMAYTDSELTKPLVNMELDLQNHVFPDNPAAIPFMPDDCHEAARMVSQAAVQAMFTPDDTKEFYTRINDDQHLDKIYCRENIMCFQDGKALLPDPIFVQFPDNIKGYGVQMVQDKKTKEFYLLDHYSQPIPGEKLTKKESFDILGQLRKADRNPRTQKPWYLIDWYRLGKIDSRGIVYAKEGPSEKGQLGQLYFDYSRHTGNKKFFSDLTMRVKDAIQVMKRLHLGSVPYSEKDLLNGIRLYDNNHHLFPAEQLDNLTDYLETSTAGSLSCFRELSKNQDLNQDGYPDTAIIFETPSEAPTFQTLNRSSDQNGQVRLVPKLGMLFQRDSQGVILKIMPSDALEDLVWEQTQMKLPDGLHYVILSPDRIESVSNGWYAEVRLLKAIPNEDPMIDVPTWEYAGSTRLYIAENAQIMTYLEQPEGKSLENIEALFAEDNRSIRVLAEISNGDVIAIIQEYSPVLENYD